MGWAEVGGGDKSKEGSGEMRADRRRAVEGQVRVAMDRQGRRGGGGGGGGAQEDSAIVRLQA